MLTIILKPSSYAQLQLQLTIKIDSFDEEMHAYPRWSIRFHLCFVTRRVQMHNIQKIKKRDTRDKKQKGAYVDRTRGCLADPTSFVVTLTNFTLNYYHRLSTGPCRIAASFAADVVKISMRCPSEWRFSAQPPWNSDHTIPNERPSLLPSFRSSILLRLDQDLGTIHGRTVWITKQDSWIRQFG